VGQSHSLTTSLHSYAHSHIALLLEVQTNPAAEVCRKNSREKKESEQTKTAEKHTKKISKEEGSKNLKFNSVR
jgi:hypothetical protein